MITAPLPPDAPVGIYIHVPFCAHICPYCDFTTYAGKAAIIPAYVDAVCRELASRANEIGERPAATVYLGGGTPSLLPAAQIQQIMDTCRTHYTLLAGAEVTMEANPNGLSPEQLAGYRAAGVNRLSIGAQTLDHRGLRRLGRQHEAADVIRALEMAHAAGIVHVNLDFIFGWPGQTREFWRHDLETVVQLGAAGPDHLSLYSLIIEPGTPYADAQARGILTIPTDDEAADLYEDAIAILADAGWTHYEVANWSREADGYSRHNAIYWQHGDYLGIGAGAFGTIGAERAMNHLLPETYIAAITRGERPVSNIDMIDERTARSESMMLGLRLLTSGVEMAAFAARHGASIETCYPGELDRLVRLGMITTDGGRVRVKARGAMVMNDVAEAFLSCQASGG